MIPHTRSAAAAVSLSAALAIAVAACSSTGEPATGQTAAAATAASPAEAAPWLGTASAALQTGVSTGAIMRAPQRPAPVPPPPATGPSIAAAHAAPSAPQAPLIPEPAPAATPKPAARAEAAARPSAPAPAEPSEPQQASLSAAELVQARELFGAFSCGACHVLADADGTGHVGPALDGNRALTLDSVIEIVTKGRGAMPGFGGQMSDEEIALLSSYIVQVRK